MKGKCEESAGGRRRYCKMCKEQVGSKMTHLYAVHLSKDIAKCSVCPYGSKYSLTAVEKHISAKHKRSAAKALDLRSKLSLEIDTVYNLCYGNAGKSGIKRNPITGSYCHLCRKNIDQPTDVEHICKVHLRKPLFRYASLTLPHSLVIMPRSV